MRKSSLPNISDEEREARIVAVRFARASVALEGFDTSDPEELKHDERYISGELTLAEYIDPSCFEPVDE